MNELYLCADLTELRLIFDTNCRYEALRLLKYLNCLHELRVTAAAPAAECVDKRAKSSGQTKMSNFLLFLGHKLAPVSFTSRSILCLACLPPSWGGAPHSLKTADFEHQCRVLTRHINPKY